MALNVICIGYAIKETALSLKYAVVEKQFCDAFNVQPEYGMPKTLSDNFTLFSTDVLSEKNLSFVLDNLNTLRLILDIYETFMLEEN